MRVARKSIQLSPRLWGCGVVAALVILSFLPSSLKALLHTRGVLHYWAHAYLFIGMTALFLEGAGTFRRRISITLRIVLLGCSIELLQTHGHFQALELSDVGSDLAGIGFGAFVSTLRSASHFLADPLGLFKPRSTDLYWG